MNSVEFNHRGRILNQVETEETQPIQDQPVSHQAQVILIKQPINTIQHAHTQYLQIIHQKSPQLYITAINQNWIIETFKKATVTYFTRGILGLLYFYFIYFLYLDLELKYI